MSTHERTGWRDQELSLRHRAWGFNVPMTDIDFLVCDYDQRKVVAIIEYKFRTLETCKHRHRMNASLEALCDLANRAGIPFFVVYYLKEPIWLFSVFPINTVALALVPGPLRRLGEAHFVSGLYSLRHRQIPGDIHQSLSRGLLQ